MKKTFDSINELIVSGQGSLARKRLKAIAEGKVAREDRLHFSQLSRRANLHSLAVQLLNPIVRPKGKKHSDATDGEKAEYAASLSYIGAAEEALELLKSVDTKKNPEALLFECFALFNQWNYKDAIPDLEAFIHSPISDYQVLVGKVNLAAALVYERQTEKAQALLNELLSATEKKYQLLQVNSLQLATQNALHLKRIKDANQYLDKATSLVETMGEFEKTAISKWRAITEFQKNPKNELALARLHRVRNDAEEHRYWETVRDCDRYEAINRRDKTLFEYVYFGSPYQSFRDRLLKDYQASPEQLNNYHWCLFNGKNSRHRLNLLMAEESKCGNRLKIGQALHRLLIQLASDFYRPTRVAVAHAKLFPGEYFNPLTTPPRIYEIVRRLRGWFEESGLPLKIEERAGFYKLVAVSPIVIEVEPSYLLGNREHTFAEKLKKVYSANSFSVSEASRALEVSPRSALRILDQLRQDKTLLREGKGPSTRYQFLKKSA